VREDWRARICDKGRRWRGSRSSSQQSTFAVMCISGTYSFGIAAAAPFVQTWTGLSWWVLVMTVPGASRGGRQG
jgi:hypothetical protein